MKPILHTRCITGGDSPLIAVCPNFSLSPAHESQSFVSVGYYLEIEDAEALRADLGKKIAEAKHKRDVAATPARPKFEQTSCSHCGSVFGPGDHGYSHCEDHAHLTPIPDKDVRI